VPLDRQRQPTNVAPEVGRINGPRDCEDMLEESPQSNKGRDIAFAVAAE
jgi:hypothetical protein